jgi:hypothetical protein
LYNKGLSSVGAFRADKPARALHAGVMLLLAGHARLPYQSKTVFDFFRVLE